MFLVAKNLELSAYIFLTQNDPVSFQKKIFTPVSMNYTVNFRGIYSTIAYMFLFLDDVDKITVTLTFQRRAGFYILQIYIPSVFLVFLSWLSFFMESKDIANRLALEVTMILSIVFLLGNSNNSLPHLSYVKASDLFIIVSFGFIFMALLQTMFTYHLEKKKDCCEKSIASNVLVGFCTFIFGLQ